MFRARREGANVETLCHAGICAHFYTIEGKQFEELASGIEGFIRGIHHWAKPLIFHILHCARSISRPGSRSDQLQKMTVGIAEVEASPDTVRE